MSGEIRRTDFDILVARVSEELWSTQQMVTPQAVAQAMRGLAPQWCDDATILQVYEGVRAFRKDPVVETGDWVPAVVKMHVKEWRAAVSAGETIKGFYEWRDERYGD